MSAAQFHAGLLGVWLYTAGVLASMKFKFARAISLGLSIGNMAKRPAAVLLAPTLAQLLPPA